MQPPWFVYLRNEPPTGVPKGFWRATADDRTAIRMGCALLLAYLVFLTVGLLAAARLIIHAPLSLIVIANGTAFTVLWWCHRVYRSTVRRFENSLAKADYRFCLDCAYDLQGLPQRHVCPECGREYEIEILQADWKRWLDTLRST